MKQCLIVDDSRVIRKIARKVLEGLDFSIEEAEDGASALEHCRQRMPDVVLLDWNMPHTGAADFLATLRREPGGDQPAVIFCTNEHNQSQIMEAIGAGADDYLLKPFDSALLRAKFVETGLCPR